MITVDSSIATTAQDLRLKAEDHLPECPWVAQVLVGQARYLRWVPLIVVLIHLMLGDINPIHHIHRPDSVVVPMRAHTAIDTPHHHCHHTILWTPIGVNKIVPTLLHHSHTRPNLSLQATMHHRLVVQLVVVAAVLASRARLLHLHHQAAVAQVAVELPVATMVLHLVVLPRRVTLHLRRLQLWYTSANIDSPMN